jgi:hypothetical protein
LESNKSPAGEGGASLKISFLYGEERSEIAPMPAATFRPLLPSTLRG